MSNIKIKKIVYVKDAKLFELDIDDVILNLPIGSDSQFGKIKLSDAIDSVSSALDGVASTPKAVKTVSDNLTNLTSKVNEVKTASDLALETTNSNTLKIDDINSILEKGKVEFVTVLPEVTEENVLYVLPDDSEGFLEDDVYATKEEITNFVTKTEVGDLTNLTTEAKDNLVNAINEVKTSGGSNSGAGVPTGTLLPFMGTSIPEGYLLCNGAAVSRTTFANLFKVIGTLWGAGDGSTTFNLPDFNDRFIEGTTDTTKVGKKLEAGLPNITGSFTIQIDDGKEEHTGVFNEVTKYNSQGYNRTGSVPGWDRFNFDASVSSNIYNNDITTVQPASIYSLIIIKT